MPDPHTNSCCNYSDLIEFIHSRQLLCLSSSHSLPVRAGASIDPLGSNTGNVGEPSLGLPWGFIVCPELGSAGAFGEGSPAPQHPIPAPAQASATLTAFHHVSVQRVPDVLFGEAILHFYRKITSN